MAMVSISTPCDWAMEFVPVEDSKACWIHEGYVPVDVSWDVDGALKP